MVASAAVVISTITFDVASPSTVDWLAYLLSLVAVGVAVWMADLGRTHGPVRPAPDPLALARRMPRWAWRVALGCALVGAIAAATIALDSVPRGLWFDEAETGLQARRLLLSIFASVTAMISAVLFVAVRNLWLLAGGLLASLFLFLLVLFIPTHLLENPLRHARGIRPGGSR